MIDTINSVQNYFSALSFKEDTHTYYVDDNKLGYSVSGLIKKCVKPFEKELVAERVANSKGISKKDVIKEWDKERDYSCDLGTKVHKFAEDYFYDNSLVPRDSFEKAVVKFWGNHPETVSKFIPELQMYHKEYMFAGTLDLILKDETDGSFILVDYKTNKDLYKNYKNNKLLKPFDNLLDSPISKYYLQLSYYQILFEQTGNKVSKRKIVWLKPDGTYKVENTPDMRLELNNYLKTIYNESF